MRQQNFGRLIAVSVVALGLTACAATPTKPGDAGAQGFSAARLARIAPVVQGQVAAGTVPGAVTLVARNGEVVHFEAHGFQDAKKTKPLGKDALFRLASMTKPLTSVATMMLVEQGRLNLQDPIAKWLPELKDLKVETPAGDVAPNRAILVHDLLRHTAGLVYGGATRSARVKKLYEDLNIEAREKPISSEQMLKNLGTIPVVHQPGTFWEYSIATDVLGLLIERVAGQTLDVLLADMLTKPLGMNDTAFWVPPEKVARLAEALDADPLKASMLLGYRQFTAPSPQDHLKGGAGMVGTASDYLKFLQMLANGGHFEGKRYLSKKTVEFMLSDHTIGMGGTTIASTGAGYGFGLGFAVRQGAGMGWVPGSQGDAMWAGAWGTSFWIDPKENLVGIYMSQGPSTRVTTRMVFKNLVYGAMVD